MPESFERMGGKREAPNAGPIYACVGPEESFAPEDKEALRELNAEPVDYYFSREERARHGFKHGGEYQYLISPIDEKNKRSHGYESCTGVVVVGIDAAEGKNISFLTHQPPYNIGMPHESDFDKDFLETLHDFARRVRSETVDAVLFGGEYAQAEHDPTGAPRDSYGTSRRLLTEAIRSVLHRDPQVISRPDHAQGDTTDVVFDTARRRLYVFQPGAKREDVAP